MKTRKFLAVSAVMAMALAGLAACSSGGTTSPGDSGSSSGGGSEPVTLTFWHNSTTGEGKAYWDEVAKAYMDANPNVTIEIQAIQNEDMDGKLQTALNAGDAPDIFMARGGGKLADIVAAGQVMDLSDKITDATKAAVGEGVLGAFTIDGKLYGMPTAILPGGMFYSKDLFKQAGITSTPANFDEMNADVQKLKDAGIAPIALGGKDAWPAAHWYYFFALRDCSQDVMNKASQTRKFDDPCWLKAGEDLQAFANTKPFNEGFLSTSAQQGAGSSAGMIANHQAAMELMGAWDPGVIASLTPDQKPLADLGWFPFPAVSGGAGDPTAMMGGVDGYACWVKAPAAVRRLPELLHAEGVAGEVRDGVPHAARQQGRAGRGHRARAPGHPEGVQQLRLHRGVAGHDVRPEHRQRAERRCRGHAGRQGHPAGDRRRGQQRRCEGLGI